MEFVTIFLSSLLTLAAPVNLIGDRVVEDAIRSNVYGVDRVAVRIDNTPNYQVLNGKVDRARIAMRGLQLSSKVRIEALEVDLDQIDANLDELRSDETHEIGHPSESSFLSQTSLQKRAEELDIAPEILEGSPVLQQWLEEVPDVLEEIRHDPSFRTRIRFGYSEFPSTDDKGGFHVGIEDIFIGKTGLTVSGEYQQTFDEDERRTWGGDVRYHVLPLGSYVNLAPVVGYRNIETGGYSTDGINVGARLMLALSRTGAADISLTQSFVSPGSDDEVGITTLSVGYAVTSNLRLSTDIQKQNSQADKDSRVGISLEWMP